MQSRLFKNPNFPSLTYELGNTWKYTQPQTNILNPNVEFMDELGKWGIHIKEDDHISNLT